MTASLIIVSATCVTMILSVLFFPRLRIRKLRLDTYYLITILGAILVLCLKLVDINTLASALFSDSPVNPLKILVLFLSMTLLSVYLDELGFFRYLASAALRHAGTGQTRLFVILYITVAVLTVFTSNDVIILSFTPFICYFSKNAKIDPLPYLFAEFVAANTWSAALIIGNPTNIYLATSCGVDFLSYLKISALPTLFAGLTSFAIMLLIFRKKLSVPLSGVSETTRPQDRVLLMIGIIHLLVCTILLAVSSYVKGMEMWIISLAAVLSLFLCTAIVSLVRKINDKTGHFGEPLHENGLIAVKNCLKRAPYPLIPFLISMFVLVESLSETGVTAKLGEILSGNYDILTYGVSSFLCANFINNIPMSVLFSAIINSAHAGTGAVFAAIIGSNLGALLTPVGALAGIMFGNLLNAHGFKFTIKDFLKMGFFVAIPALFAALGGLYLVTAI